MQVSESRKVKSLTVRLRDLLSEELSDSPALFVRVSYDLVDQPSVGKRMVTAAFSSWELWRLTF